MTRNMILHAKYMLSNQYEKQRCMQLGMGIHGTQKMIPNNFGEISLVTV